MEDKKRGGEYDFQVGGVVEEVIRKFNKGGEI